MGEAKYDSGIKHDLRIRYKLMEEPKDIEIDNWFFRTTKYQYMMTLEDAGKKAAEEVFPSYNSTTYLTTVDIFLIDTFKKVEIIEKDGEKRNQDKNNKGGSNSHRINKNS